jgi:hypothetical protein
LGSDTPPSARYSCGRPRRSAKRGRQPWRRGP